MRRPTTDSELYAWHANAMRGAFGDDLVITEEPQPGWFKRRLVKGGSFVPARIFMVREVDEATGELLSDEALRCEVYGHAADPETQWTWLASEPISKQEFDYMMATDAHMRQHEPDQPQANPKQAIDWMKVRL